MGENSAGVKLDAEIQEKESQLTALKAEIKSRERLLAQLTDQKTDSGLQDKAQRLENEIFIRDRHTLNERVISLDSKLRERGQDKSKSKDELITKLQGEIAAVEKQREDAESKASILQTKLTSTTKTLEDEVKNYRLLQETEVHEHENTRTRLEMKDRKLLEGRGDMARLAKTIKDLTKINGELGEKIGKLNQEIESARADAFKVQARAQYADGQVGVASDFHRFESDTRKSATPV